MSAEDIESITKRRNKSNAKVQLDIKSRRRGGVEVATQMLALFLFFNSEGLLNDEIKPYFAQFLKQRSEDAKYYMSYYDKSVSSLKKKYIKAHNKADSIGA